MSAVISDCPARDVRPRIDQVCLILFSAYADSPTVTRLALLGLFNPLLDSLSCSVHPQKEPFPIFRRSGNNSENNPRIRESGPRSILVYQEMIELPEQRRRKDSVAGMQRKNVFTAVVVGAALTLALPGIAYAATPTVVTPGLTATWTAPGVGQRLATSTSCSGTDVLSGGGILETGSGTGANDVHVMETKPDTSGGTTNLTQWIAAGGTGNQGTGTYKVQPFALCFTDATITGTSVVTNSTGGAFGTGGTAHTTATCPSNTRLIGGGGESTLASNKSVKLIASFPSDSSGNAASGGSTNPDSWTVWTLNGGMSSTGNTTYAYALCGTGTNVGNVTVTVQHTHNTTALTSGSQTTTTGTACGGGTGMLSGGASISGGDPTTAAFTAPGSQGDHLDGDYPSTAGGAAASNGSSPANWTAIGTTGGGGSTGSYVDAWALCA